MTGSSPARVHRALSVNGSDDHLLSLRMCDLGVDVEGTWLAECVAQLCADLKRRDIGFCPHTWLSHDWFSPDGVPGIAIPFYLAHPRLMRLERRQIREVEGGSRQECMKILRHECGHAIQHAYQLQRRRRYQRLFGKSSQPYPESYRPNPASHRYVQHLRFYYAQSHPDEDFAETFAVWLLPAATWRKRYQTWPALRKLEYVDELMSEIKHTRPLISSRRQIDPVHSLKMRLRDYYADKRERYDNGHSDIYDRDLLRLFSNDPGSGNYLASTFLRCHRREIRALVGRDLGGHLFALEHVLDDMIGRCRELKLRAVSAERTLLKNFAVLLTRKTALFLSRRSARIAL
jgi:Putative zinc-binding metallo-peptidase